MDISPVAPAIIAGVIATGTAILTGVVRTRNATRTSARLIYAELVRNSAALTFYWAAGTWPKNTLSLEAWNANLENLAKGRNPQLFQAAQGGYAALESVAFAATSTGIPGKEHLEDLYARRVVVALRELGRAARVSDGAIKEETDRLTARPLLKGLNPYDFLGAPPDLLKIVASGQLTVGIPVGTAVAAAIAGQVSQPATSGLPTIRIFDGAHRRPVDVSQMTPLRISGGPPSKDSVAEQLFHSFETALGFYATQFPTMSYGGDDYDVTGIVHVDESWPNAYWSGDQLLCGDGDGVLFGPMVSVDIVAHELMRKEVSNMGVSRGGSLSDGQAGPLQIAACDAFSCMACQWRDGQTADQASWVVGSSIIIGSSDKTGLRSLKAPGRAFGDRRLGNDPQVAHMSHYVKSQELNTNYLNSGIPAHAFYLLATSLGGYAWETAGRIWYGALNGEWSAPPTFATFAGATVSVASRDFQERPALQEKVRASWLQVGVKPIRSRKFLTG